MKTDNIISWTQAGLSAVAAWLLAKMGLLFYVLAVLLAMMILDYVTGLLAAKREAIEHPDDPAYGWSSKRGAEGIIKKAAYACVIAAAMGADWIIFNVAAEIGIETKLKAFFGLLVAVWYTLNEILSIIENAGRMGAPVPEWLAKNIAALKKSIEKKGGADDGETDH